jgi:hypothetical protein
MDLEDIFVLKINKQVTSRLYYILKKNNVRVLLESLLRNYGIFCDLPAIYPSLRHRSVYKAIFKKNTPTLYLFTSYVRLILVVRKNFNNKINKKQLYFR